MTLTQLLLWIGALPALFFCGWLFMKFRYRRGYYVIDIAGFFGLLAFGMILAVVYRNADVVLLAVYFSVGMELMIIYQSYTDTALGRWAQKRVSSNSPMKAALEQQLRMLEGKPKMPPEKDADDL
jgi:hypothetical protein